MKYKNILILYDRVQAQKYIKNKKYKSFLIYLTNDFYESDKIRSIPLYVENNCHKLKEEYLNILTKISNKKIKNKKLYEYNILNNNNSLWWQSGFMQKSNFSESKEINMIIKIIAINRIRKEHNISRLKIYLEDKKLLRNYELILKTDLNERTFIKKLYGQFSKTLKIIINLLKGIAWINYFVLNNFNLIFIKNKYIYNDITIFSYNGEFILNKNNLEIKDKYWTKLFEILYKKNKSFNIINIFIKDKFNKKTFQYYKKLKKANIRSPKNQFLILESFINFRIIIKSFLSFTKLIIKNIFINYDQLFYIGNINYKKFYEKDFFNYFFGKGLIKNIIYTYLFNELFKNFKTKQNIFYLNENTFWEYSLLSNSKKYNMKNVIAFPHLNIKEWDLRMFNDVKVINKNDKVFYYLPKIICAISELNFKFLSRQYKHNVEIKKVESLRFLKYANSSFEELIYNNFLNKKYKILIIGEYDDSMNRKLIKFILNSDVLSIKKYKFFYKPHPSKIFNNNLLKNTNVHICNSELVDLRPNVAICSSFTSTSIDTAALKIPTITVLDNEMPNFSPLKGTNSLFITSMKELKLELKKLCNEKFKSTVNLEKLFFLNNNLNLWSRLFDDLG